MTFIDKDPRASLHTVVHPVTTQTRGVMMFSVPPKHRKCFVPTSAIRRYPKPDRSDQVPSLTKDEDGVIDIGWHDGVMSDGRPFRAEMWAQGGVSMLTIFFSSQNIEHIDSDQIREVIVKEGLVAFRSQADTFCESTSYVDCAGMRAYARLCTARDNRSRGESSQQHVGIPQSTIVPRLLWYQVEIRR